MTQLDACLTGDQGVAGSTPASSAKYFVATDHEIFSKIILSLPLIQEMLWSISGS